MITAFPVDPTHPMGPPCYRNASAGRSAVCFAIRSRYSAATSVPATRGAPTVRTLPVSPRASSTLPNRHLHKTINPTGAGMLTGCRIGLTRDMRVLPNATEQYPVWTTSMSQALVCSTEQTSNRSALAQSFRPSFSRSSSFNSSALVMQMLWSPKASTISTVMSPK